MISRRQARRLQQAFLSARALARLQRWGASAAWLMVALLALALFIAALRAMPESPFLGGALGLLVALAVVLAGGWLIARIRQALVRDHEERLRTWRGQLRASRLTRRILGMEAYRTLWREGVIPEPSRLYPGRTYLVPIRTTPSGARILVVENDRPIGGLCLRPREPLPDPEEALTHVIAIRTNERAWLNRANYFPHDRALTPQALGLLPGRVGNYDR